MHATNFTWSHQFLVLAACCLSATTLAQPDPRDGILREALIDVDESFLKKLGVMEPGTEVPFTLFDDVSFVATTERVQETSSGFNWIGKTPTTGVGDVILSVADDAIVGTVWLDDAVYSIHGDSEGGYRVDQTNPSVFTPIHRGDVDVDHQAKTIPLKSLKEPVASAMLDHATRYNGLHARLEGLISSAALPQRVLTFLPEPGSRVDILLATTDAASQWLADNNYPRVPTAENLVAKANMALWESGITTQLHFLGVASVHYVETDDLKVDLDNLRGKPNATPSVPPHPDLNNLHGIRDILRADIVSLLVHPEEKDGHGQAIRLPGPAQSQPTPSDGKGPFEDVGFNVARIDSAVNWNTLTHEVGHTFGAAHDNYQFGLDEAAGLVETPPLPGGHGFILLEPNKRTLMAYRSFCVDVLGQPDDQTACPIIPRFSNVLQTYDGSPLGIVLGSFFAADNASVMNLTAQTVANFRHAWISP